MNRRLLPALALTLATAVPALAAEYKVVDRIKLPDGGWDYIVSDPEHGRIIRTRTDGAGKARQEAKYEKAAKELEELDDPLKREQLRQWCEDASTQDPPRRYRSLFVREEDWEQHSPRTFESMTQTYEVGLAAIGQ